MINLQRESKKWWLLVCVLLSGACGSLLDGSETNTNFLRPCDTDAQCGSDAACRCGLCTVECTANSECTRGAVVGVCSVNANCKGVAICLPPELASVDASAAASSADDDVDVMSTSTASEPPAVVSATMSTPDAQAPSTSDVTSVSPPPPPPSNAVSESAPTGTSQSLESEPPPPPPPSDTSSYSSNTTNSIGPVDDIAVNDTTTLVTGAEPGPTFDNVPPFEVQFDAGPPDGGPPPAPLRANDCGPVVTTSAGIHVSPFGSTNTDCGSADDPCDSLARGFARATETGASYLYLRQGEYVGGVSPDGPISVIGGWTPDAGAWTRSCDPPSASATIIKPLSGPGVYAELSGTIRLESLWVVVDGGYGIFATGAGTHLQLRDVMVSVGNAANGTPGWEGSSGSPPPSSCASGDGANGSPAAPAAPTPGGSFTRDGFVPGDGAQGNAGNPGHNGVHGQDVTDTCTYCAECLPAAGGTATATGGANGCGGGEGFAGGGGAGGASSVGIFAWLARVEFGETVYVTVGNGGNGGSGGSGGSGAVGGLGASGETLVCNPLLTSSCSNACDRVIEGDYGGTGGAGSAGSSGGDGAGGWSVAFVGTPNAFSGSSVTTSLGQAGAGAGNAPDGVAQVAVTLSIP